MSLLPESDQTIDKRIHGLSDDKLPLFSCELTESLRREGVGLLSDLKAPSCFERIYFTPRSRFDLHIPTFYIGVELDENYLETSVLINHRSHSTDYELLILSDLLTPYSLPEDVSQLALAVLRATKDRVSKTPIVTPKVLSLNFWEPTQEIPALLVAFDFTAHLHRRHSVEQGLKIVAGMYEAVKEAMSRGNFRTQIFKI